MIWLKRLRCPLAFVECWRASLPSTVLIGRLSSGSWIARNHKRLLAAELWMRNRYGRGRTHTYSLAGRG